jgi:hypothetical protein
MAICEDNLLYGTFELASPGWTNRHDVAALIAHAVGRPIAARRVDPLALKNVSAPMRTMFEHYDHHGLLANPLTLEAILGHPARLLSTYLSELAEGNASRPQRASKPLPPKRLSGAAIND